MLVQEDMALNTSSHSDNWSQLWASRLDGHGPGTTIFWSPVLSQQT